MERLEFPNASHESGWQELIAEWGKLEKIPTAPMKLFSGENFSDFLSIVSSETSADTLPPEKVPAHLFLLVKEETNRILGAIQIRHHINHPALCEVG